MSPEWRSPRRHWFAQRPTTRRKPRRPHPISTAWAACPRWAIRARWSRCAAGAATAEQKPLWDKLNGAIQSAADKERQLCANLPTQPGPEAQGTILDRMSRREQFLSARLQGMQQARPALEALYQALSPE
ncbi:MAG: hypothetical protein E6G81_03970, partial [Alphaproteobacteria bacterium]